MTAVSPPEPGVRYRPIAPERAARELEEELLRRWDAEDLFGQSLAARAGASEFVFFEGPPTANGLPGIHHVFSRTLKDLFCRHRVMRGFHVTRKAGWDTHGLPVEIEVEKELGISGKQDIERMGVETFNRRCRESVWRYREQWERLSARMGYWLDYAHPYVTYSNEYVESVWWALKTLHERGLLYQGHKILPYCPRCGTALSSHEVALGYEDVEDPSIFLALDLVDEQAEGGGTKGVGGAPNGRRRRIVVWTTTPWTVVANAALAVHPDLTYVEVRKHGRSEWTLVLAEARAIAVLGPEWRSRWDVLARFPGRELAGKRYRRALDWAPYAEGAHEIIVAEDFVSAEDGSGVVHLSPAFGADDYGAGQKHGLAFLQPVNARGEFPAEMPVVGGRFVKDADALIIEELKRRDLLWKAGTLNHSYPHCWRCGTPLLYYARTSWFVKTTAYRDRMLARNAAIHWTPPEVGTGRFGQWLENNIDWALSRDRYWGTPLPVWVNDADASEIEVIGSYAELGARAGRALPGDFDPHKPFIDQYAWPAKSGTGTMRRVSEVIDTWFDSGSMSFAQWHYPFENREAFARHFPADFIAEGVDQTRGWFYSLLAIATGLGDALDAGSGRSEGRPPHAAGSRLAAGGAEPASPYRNVVVNDLVLDAAGQKMSKTRGNTVDPMAVMDRHGADAVRLFLVTASQIWKPRSFDETVIRETAGRFLVTLKNLYSGAFAQYANFGWAPSPRDPAREARAPLDQWVLSRLATVEAEANRLLEAYDATAAARLVMEFVDEDVSKWYVRRSRERLYDVASADNRSAFATLHEVLVASCRLLAPFAPYLTDWIHRELTGDSVHLASYVRPHPFAPLPTLEAAMREIRALASLAHAAREAARAKTRQPLARLVCVTGPLDAAAHALVLELASVLAAELNVKRVEFATSADALVTLEAKPNFRALGKKWGKETPRAAAAVSALTAESLRAYERGEPVLISVDGRDHALAADDLVVQRRASGALVVEEDGARFAAIDPTVTPALRDEGIAREVVSRIQRLRKESGLAVSDRIRLYAAGPAEFARVLEAYRPWIAGEVLAREVVVRDALPADVGPAVTLDLDGLTAHIALTRDR